MVWYRTTRDRRIFPLRVCKDPLLRVMKQRQRDYCIDLLGRYHIACDNPDFHPARHVRILQNCTTKPPPRQLETCIGLRRTYQHGCSKMSYPEPVPGGHEYFLHKLEELQAKCDKAYLEAREKRGPRPAAPRVRAEMVSPERHPVEPLTGKFRDLVLDDDEDEERGDAATAAEVRPQDSPTASTSPVHTRRAEARRRTRELRRRQREEVEDYMSVFRRELHEDEEEVASLRQATRGAKRGRARAILSELFHVDSEAVEDYVRARKTFVVVNVLLGRRGDEDVEANVARALIWKFSPRERAAPAGEVAEPESTSSAPYGFQRVELRFKDLTNLKTYLLATSPAEAAGSETKDLAFFRSFLSFFEGKPMREVAETEEDIERLVGCQMDSIEEQTLLLLRTELAAFRDLFLNEERLPRRRVCFVSGMWEEEVPGGGDGGRIRWAYDVDELRDITAPIPSVFACEGSLLRRQEELHRNGVQLLAAQVKLRNILAARLEEFLRYHRAQAQTLRDYFDVTYPVKICANEKRELDAFLSQPSEDEAQRQLEELRDYSLQVRRLDPEVKAVIAAAAPVVPAPLGRSDFSAAGSTRSERRGKR